MRGVPQTKRNYSPYIYILSAFILFLKFFGIRAIKNSHNTKNQKIINPIINEQNI